MDWGLVLSKFLTYLAYPLPIGLTLAWIAWGLLFSSKSWKASLLLGLSLGWLTLAASPPFAAMLYQRLEQQYPPQQIIDTANADVIISLGGNLAPPRPPRLDIELVQSSDRLQHTVRLYRAGKAPKIILSGGNVFPQAHIENEASYAARLLKEWGVDDGALIVEGDSRTTYENAINSRRLMEKNDFKTALLVTSASHMPRALAAFRSQNINVIPATTDVLITANDNPTVLRWLPSSGALSATTTAVHEYFGTLVYRLRGWIK